AQRSRLRNLEEDDVDITKGTGRQALEEKQAAPQREYRGSTRSICQRLADTETKPGAHYLITKPPARREVEIKGEARAADRPKEKYIDTMKAATFSEIWSCGEIPREKHTGTLQELRQQALDTECPHWSVEDPDETLKGEPDRGRGVDVLNRADIRRVPCEGRQATVDQFNACEQQLMRQWQILRSLAMVKPMPAKGGMALALLPQLVRAWEPLHGPAASARAKDRELCRGAAVASISFPSGAMRGAIADECCDERRPNELYEKTQGDAWSNARLAAETAQAASIAAATDAGDVALSAGNANSRQVAGRPTAGMGPYFWTDTETTRIKWQMQSDQQEPQTGTRWTCSRWSQSGNGRADKKVKHTDNPMKKHSK
ncbi:unnamed protein product, partial [Prorocentrum cordatum]